MLGGIIIPGHPLGNLYFTAWSHSLIAQSLNLAGDLKLGSYREWLRSPTRYRQLTKPSQDSLPNHVLDSSMGYRVWRLHQLCRDDLDCQ